MITMHKKLIANLLRSIHSLVVTEYKNDTLSVSTSSSITAALKIGSNITALIAGKNTNSIVKQVSNLKGVSNIISAELPNLLAENYSQLVLEKKKI